jgi:Spy/CpxP family protein refolding chaperone
MSKASRSKLTLVTTFTLALGAGLVMGMAAARRGAAARSIPPAQQSGRSKTAVELNLTPQQEEQVKAIWANVTQGPIKTINESRKSLQKERDDEINGLFSSEQKAEYDRIQADYATKASNLGNKRQQQIDAAVEQVKKVLNDTQRQKYEQMLKDRGGHGRRVFGGPGRESRNSPTTHPAAAGAGGDGQNTGRPPNGSSSINKPPAPATRPGGDPS